MTIITLFFSLMPISCLGLEITLNAHQEVDHINGYEPTTIQTQKMQTNYQIDPKYNSQIIVGKTYLPPSLPYMPQMTRNDHENAVNADQRSNYQGTNFITQNLRPYKFLSPPISYSHQYGTRKKENEWTPIVPTTTQNFASSESQIKTDDIMQNLVNHVQWMDQNAGFQPKGFSHPPQNNEFEIIGKSIDQILDQNNLLIKNNAENINTKDDYQQNNNVRGYLPPKLVSGNFPTPTHADDWKEFNEEFSNVPILNNKAISSNFNKNSHVSNSTKNSYTPPNSLIQQSFIQNFYQPENYQNEQPNLSVQPLSDQNYIQYGVPPDPKSGIFKINYPEEVPTGAITINPSNAPITMSFEPQSLRTSLLKEKIPEFMISSHDQFSSAQPVQVQENIREYYQEPFVSNNQPTLTYGNLPISNHTNVQSFQHSTEINQNHSSLDHSNLSSLGHLENNSKKITTSVYTFAAEDESDDDIEQNLTNYGPIRKNYRVVFIKAPQQLTKRTLRIAQALNEEKTVIYVLSKKADPNEIQKALETIPTSTSRPEVHFLKYRTNQEAELAQKEIQDHYHTLGEAGNVNQEEILPVFSVQNEGQQSQNIQPYNSYLPPN